MTIQDDLRIGLAPLRQEGYNIHDDLAAKGWAVILMDFPDAPLKLHKDELSIQIRVASSQRYFSLYSPLAMITGPLESSVYEHLLRRNFYVDQVGAAGFAVMQFNDIDVIAAVQHWPFNQVTPTHFADLLEGFIEAYFKLLREIVGLAAKVDALNPIGSLR